MISELYTTSRKSLEVVANHSMVLTYNDGQLKRWKEYLTRAFNRITLGEVLPLANEIANHYNMRIRIVPPRRSEIVLVINALKRSIVVWFDGFSAELFIAALAITTNLLLPLLRKSWESETVPREQKKGMIVEVPKKGTRFECDNWRGICVRPAVAKIIDKVILERIKKHLESLIDREQAGFRSCIDHLNTLRIIQESARN